MLALHNRCRNSNEFRKLKKRQLPCQVCWRCASTLHLRPLRCLRKLYRILGAQEQWHLLGCGPSCILCSFRDDILRCVRCVWLFFQENHKAVMIEAKQWLTALGTIPRAMIARGIAIWMKSSVLDERTQLFSRLALCSRVFTGGQTYVCFQNRSGIERHKR